jgi:hypothetical protein
MRGYLAGRDVALDEDAGRAITAPILGGSTASIGIERLAMPGTAWKAYTDRSSIAL